MGHVLTSHGVKMNPAKPAQEMPEKSFNRALEGLSRVLDIADDILVYGVGNNEQEATADHNRNLEALQRQVEAETKRSSFHGTCTHFT